MQNKTIYRREQPKRLFSAVCIYLKAKCDISIPELQQTTATRLKNNRKVSFLRVRPKYSSKTLLTGKTFKSMLEKALSKKSVEFCYNLRRPSRNESVFAHIFVVLSYSSTRHPCIYRKYKKGQKNTYGNNRHFKQTNIHTRKECYGQNKQQNIAYNTLHVLQSPICLFTNCAFSVYMNPFSLIELTARDASISAPASKSPSSSGYSHRASLYRRNQVSWRLA